MCSGKLVLKQKSWCVMMREEGAMSAPNAGHTQDIEGTNVYSTRARAIYIFM